MDNIKEQVFKDHNFVVHKVDSHRKITHVNYRLKPNKERWKTFIEFSGYEGNVAIISTGVCHAIYAGKGSVFSEIANEHMQYYNNVFDLLKTNNISLSENDINIFAEYIIENLNK